MTRFLDWLGYQLVMWLPYWIACNPDSKFGKWCLPRAGAWAYRDDVGGASSHE